MAEPISAAPVEGHPKATDLGGASLEELIEAAWAGSGDALTVILERANTPSTRALLAALAILARGLAVIREPTAHSIERAIKASVAVHDSAQTPSWSDLIRQMRKPSTRRGISVALAALRGLGGEDVTGP